MITFAHETTFNARPTDYHCWRDLGAAVVKRGADDWRIATEALLQTEIGSQNERYFRRLRRDCETFLRSNWCEILGGVEGDIILHGLRVEAPENRRKMLKGVSSLYDDFR